MSEQFSHRDVAHWLLACTAGMARVASVGKSYVWPPYDNESGFLVILEDGREFEVLVSEREKP